MFYQNGNMLDKLCQYLKVHEQRSWMNLNSVPLLLRTILCYPKKENVNRNLEIFYWQKMSNIPTSLLVKSKFGHLEGISQDEISACC